MEKENELLLKITQRFPELEASAAVADNMRVNLGTMETPLFYKVIEFLHDELKLTNGHNVIGTDEGDNLGFLYLVSGEDHIIVSMRILAPKSNPAVRSMTYMYKSFTLFERELCDLYGANVTGLPEGPHYPLPDGWPKDQWPMRKEWDPKKFNRDTMTYDDGTGKNVGKEPERLPDTNELPQSEIEENKTSTVNRVNVPIGPQHPSLDEPASFLITLEGETVENAVIGIGYNHRGLEKACEERTYIQDLYIIERVCGICSHAHTSAYCMAVEKLAGVTITKRAEYIRLIVAELERLHSHLLWLGVAGHEIGFDTLFMLAWRDRERVLDVLAAIGGNRINYGINCLGGVRRDIDEKTAADVEDALSYLENSIKYFIDIASTETTLVARLAGVGPLSKEDCEIFGAKGPVARAAGIMDDIRVIEPYGAYKEIEVHPVTADSADVYGRTVVRLTEMLESIRLIREALSKIPEGELTVRVPRRIPAGEVIVRIEAPRGEDFHYVRSNGTDKPDRIRVRAPSECNWHGMQHMLEGGYLSDVPITIAAIDPCYSCTDRAITLKGEGKNKIIDWKELREYGIKFNKERGIDLSRVKL